MLEHKLYIGWIGGNAEVLTCGYFESYFPMWYPGSGVVLDSIVSWSLPPFLHSNQLVLREYVLT